MDILGIGPLELVLILVVALAVFGPDKLPAIGSKLGRAMRDMRRATRDFSREIETARQVFEEPVKEVTQPLQDASKTVKELQGAARAIGNPGQALRDSVMRELSADVKPEQGPSEESPALGDQVPASDAAPDEGGQAVTPPTAEENAPVADTVDLAPETRVGETAPEAADQGGESADPAAEAPAAEPNTEEDPATGTPDPNSTPEQ